MRAVEPHEGPSRRADAAAAFDAPLLLGRYRPLERIGRGGSATVFRGVDETLGRPVAIKLFHAGTARELERHGDELRALAGLAHHGIVGVIDAGVDLSQQEDPRPFLVMEYVSGMTAYIHAHGVVHRDVTPTNIMLVDYGTPSLRRRARLTDFGIAVIGGSTPGDSDVAVGTTAYLSPEQATGQSVGTPTDIYSLGLVLLELFTGRREFPGPFRESMATRLERDPVVGRGVPRAWRPLLRDMTARQPARRPDAAAVLESSRRLLRARRR